MNIICVRFHKTGKLYFYNNNDEQIIEVGKYIIAETQYGKSIGRIVKLKNKEELSEEDEVENYIRVATDEDIEVKKQNEIDAKQALENSKNIAKEYNLDMNFLSAEYTFDKSKLILFFAAEDRVDFRELVKNLASVYKVRIELRQVGARDEIKSCPNLGICGKEVCCRTFLPDFEPVTVKMAKEQGLQINMQKLSGACGRLKCCLKFEQEVYEEKNARLPKVGDIVKTEDGDGKVIQVEILKERVKVRFDDEEGYRISIYEVKDLK